MIFSLHWGDNPHAGFIYQELKVPYTPGNNDVCPDYGRSVVLLSASYIKKQSVQHAESTLCERWCFLQKVSELFIQNDDMENVASLI